jgi:uncharacterized protein YxeA
MKMVNYQTAKKAVQENGQTITYNQTTNKYTLHVYNERGRKRIYRLQVKTALKLITELELNETPSTFGFRFTYKK